MNTNLLKKLTTGLAAALTVVAMASTASARTTVASIGTAVIGSQRAEFDFISAGVMRVVAGSGTWITPMLLDNPGAKTITVTGAVASGSGLVCQAISVSASGATLGASQSTTFPVSGAFFGNVDLTLSSAAVPAGAQVFVACALVGTGTLLNGFNYNQ